MDSAFRLSVAIPVDNEESVLPELLRRTCTALDQVPRGRHEIVFVDDGTTDQTFAILEDAARRDSRIVAISLSRNFGHQAALTAAPDHVTGDAAVVMDGDLQHLPEVIPQFVERYNQGYDVVCLCEASPPKGTVAAAPLLFCLLQVASWAFRCPPAFGFRRFRFDVAPSD